MQWQGDEVLAVLCQALLRANMGSLPFSSSSEVNRVLPRRLREVSKC